MKRKIYIWAIALASLISTNSLAQNAITLDPNTTGTNDARTLSEGVGSTSQNLWQYKTPTSSSSWSSRLGIKSFTTTSSSNTLTAIYGLADKSTTRNIGIYGGAEAEGNAIAYGGRFSAFGSTNNNTYGLFSSAHNQGNGGVYGGYFSIYNLSNEGRGGKYGVFISNNANYNDTTTVSSRYGLYSSVGGKSRYENYGIYSNVGYGDTVTVKNSNYALYGSIRQKNTNTNYGLTINAANNGTGQAIAGQFNVNSGSKTSVGDRTAIQARNISYNDDTTTVSNKYGVHSAINGRSKYDNIAIYGQNSNYSGDTLTATTRYGISGSASGKSKFQNIGIRGNASTNSGTTASATGVQGSAYSGGSGSATGVQATASSGGSGSATGGNFSVNTQSSTNGAQFGIRASAANGSTTNNSAVYGADLWAYSNGNNYLQALYAEGYGSNSSTGIIHGIRSSASSNNTGNTNPTYGIYTTASGSSQGLKYGIYATSSGSGGQFAGYFQGNVHVNGSLSKSGGTFKIDHPQDPENKYLVHSFVESPEMKNIYDGTITTDANGDASILMPSYFQSLNVTFRYQLTCMGQFAQAIVSEEISNNSFKIKTDKPNVKVSWQVTGVRNDPWAQSNPIVVEQLKTGVEKGKYLNPAAYKKAENMGMYTLANTNNQTAAEREVEAKAMQSKMEQEQKQREEEQARQLSENLKEKAEAEQAELHRKAELKRREEEIEKNNGETQSN